MSLLLLFHGAPLSVVAPPARTRSTRSAGPRRATQAAGPSGRHAAAGPSGRRTSSGPKARTRAAAFHASATRIAALGYSNQAGGDTQVAAAEAVLGRSFHGLRQNQAYTVTGWTFASSEYDAGRTTTYRSIQFDTLPGGWAAAANGDADATLTTTFQNLRAAGRWNAHNPAIICLHHEATVAPFGTAGFLASDYIAMWQHIVPNVIDAGGFSVYDRFGTYNPNGVLVTAYVGWDRMFVGNGGVGPPTAGQGVDDLDPDTGLPAGQTLYTYLGSDPYNSVDSPGVLKYTTDAGVLLNPIITAAVARGKDWICGEFGCEDGSTAQDHVNKAAWVDSARQIIISRGRSRPGVCRALLLTIKADASKYNVDSSAESTAAFQRLGASTYFS